MTQGAMFTLGMLIEKEKLWVENINEKHDGNLFKVLKAWRSKKLLPIYHDLALHKVVLDMYGIEIPKATISEWLKHIPELLNEEEELTQLIEEKVTIKKEEKKYTYSEWEYLMKMKGQGLVAKQKAIITKLGNPQISDTELKKLTGVSQRVLNDINKFGITMSNKDIQKEIVDTSERLIKLGLDKIESEFDNIKIRKAQDLKSVTGAVTDIFNINRALKGEQGTNGGITINDIRIKILAKAEEKKVRAEKKKIEADIIIPKKTS